MGVCLEGGGGEGEVRHVYYSLFLVFLVFPNSCSYLGQILSHKLAHSSGVARTQLMPGHSVGTVPRPHPALGHLQYEMQKQLGGSGGCSLRKFLSFIGRF